MKIKVCGVTHPQDAELAARLGADYIGIIFAPQSKRCVTSSEAQTIARSARNYGAEPIGVFVDETIEEICSICDQTGIAIPQLHGNISRASVSALKPLFEKMIYAIPVSPDGSFNLTPELPEGVIPLFDSLAGGSGKKFSWESFSPPKSTPWILAGGLNPNNVAEAIRILKPNGVDVCSDVELPNSRRKDPLLVEAFIQSVKKEIL